MRLTDDEVHRSSYRIHTSTLSSLLSEQVIHQPVDYDFIDEKPQSNIDILSIDPFLVSV